MNNYELVEAVEYLLECRQADLMREKSKLKISVSRSVEIGDEIEEIELRIEKAREGYHE
jgi:hypothetical protein